MRVSTLKAKREGVASSAQGSSMPAPQPQQSSGPAPYFSDVPFSAWFHDAVEMLRLKQVVSGYKDAKGNATHRYGPGNPVTYGEFAKMTAALTKYLPADMTAAKHWAEPYAREARARGLTVYGDVTLNLDAPATRGAVVRTILQAYGITLQATPQSMFTDLPATHPYAKDLLTAAALGIIKGDPSTGSHSTGSGQAGQARTVRPDAPVNRAEIAKILADVSTRFTPAAAPTPSVSSASSSSAPAAHQSPPVTTGTDIRTVTSQDARVRSDSRTTAATLRFLHKGDRVEVLTILYVDWAHVKLPDGSEGYVLLRDLGE